MMARVRVEKARELLRPTADSKTFHSLFFFCCNDRGEPPTSLGSSEISTKAAGNTAYAYLYAEAQ